MHQRYKQLSDIADLESFLLMLSLFVMPSLMSMFEKRLDNSAQSSSKVPVDSVDPGFVEACLPHWRLEC